MRFIFFFLVFITLSSASYSQDNNSSKSLEKSIDSLYKISSSWELYKIIRKNRYQALKKEILDTVSIYKTDIKTKFKLINQQRDSLQKSKKIIEDLSSDLQQAISAKNEIKFLGIPFSKTVFQIAVWIKMILLLTVLGYFVYRFKNSHVVTKKAQNELTELEEEFAAFKKKSMIKEQKLRRQLQDEINKQRGI